jgi:hypothetical protein
MKTYFSFKLKKLRFQNENVYSGSTPRTVGWISKKLRVPLRKRPTKGYQRVLAVGSEMNDED